MLNSTFGIIPLGYLENTRKKSKPIEQGQMEACGGLFYNAQIHVSYTFHICFITH